MEKQPNILYVAGSNRSGSTLFGRLLGEVPDLVFGGELRYLWRRGVVENRLCSCGTPFKECSFWRAVFSEAFGGFSHVDGSRFARYESRLVRMRHLDKILSQRSSPSKYHDQLQIYSNIMRKLLDAMRHVSEAVCIVDTSKAPAFIAWYQSVFWAQPLTVHLVRNSKGVAFSQTRTKKRTDVQGKTVYMDTMKPWQSALAWLKVNALVEAAVAGAGSPRKVLHYEDLVDNVTEAVQTMLSGTSLTLPPDLFRDNRVDFGRQHIISGNPNRFDQGTVEIQADQEWKHAMSSLDRALVTIITSPLMLRYRVSR